MGIGKIRVDETARVTDAVIDELGTDSRALPEPLMEDLVYKVATELGIELTHHEVLYIIRTNIAWLFKDIDSDLIDRYRRGLM